MRLQHVLPPLVCALGFLTCAPAQTPKLLRDLNTKSAPNPTGSAPRFFANTSTHTFFSANRSDVGTELFVIDRSKPGVVTAIDIVAAGSSNPQSLTAVGDRVFFTALTPAAGRELWVSDGSAAGTVPVKDIYYGAKSSDPQWLTAMGGELYFTAYEPVMGIEMWKSDGSPNGTRRVQIVVDKSGPPRQLTAMGNQIFYTFSTKTWGEELWVTDGTSARLVVDVNYLTLSSSPTSLTAAGNRLYFVAFEAGKGEELWVTDRSGPRRVRDIVKGAGSPGIKYMAASGGRVFFAADDQTGTGVEPWVSDGTERGTKMITNLFLGSTSSSPHDFAGIPGGAVFIAIGTFGGVKLYFTDGTDKNTVQLDGSIIPNGMVVSDGKLAFVAGRTPRTGFELIRTDGSVLGTRMVKDINPGSNGSGPGYLTAVPGGGVTFAASDGVHGTEPWYSDGAAATMLADANRPSNAATDGSDPEQFAGYLTLNFFVADDGVHGQELWRTKVSGVTELVGEVNPGPGDGNIRMLGADGSDRAFFAATDGNGEELWKANSNGMWRVSSLPGTTGTFIREILVTYSKVYFTAYEPVHGTELWVHDSATGKTILIDIMPGIYSSTPMELTRVGDYVFFRARDPKHGPSLFRSNGTAAGTGVIQVPLVATSNARNLTAAGSKLFFTAETPSDGEELYCVDENPTLSVHRLGTHQPGSGSFSIRARVGVADGRMFFGFNDGTHGEELWVSDGSQQGTIMVKDIRPRSGWSSPTHLTAVGDLVFFAARTIPEGNELWLSDGTATGTRLVQDLVPGSGSSDPKNLYAAGTNLLLCSVFTTSHGRELWGVNPAGQATRLSDINPGPASADPGSFASLWGRDVLFAATDPKFGREPHIIDLMGISFPSGTGCTAVQSMREPAMNATAPQLGKLITFTIRDFQPSASGVWSIGAPIPAFSFGQCYAQVNPVGMILLPARTDAGGMSRLRVTIPNDPKLVGARVALQAAIVDTQNRPELSNAQIATIGR